MNQNVSLATKENFKNIGKFYQPRRFQRFPFSNLRNLKIEHV